MVRCGWRFFEAEDSSDAAVTLHLLARGEGGMPGMQLLTDQCAFCFETQHDPNAVNYTHFPSNPYTRERPLLSRTVFAFETPEE